MSFQAPINPQPQLVTSVLYALTVIQRNAADPPKDWTSHTTWWVNQKASGADLTPFQALADAVNAAFGGSAAGGGNPPGTFNQYTTSKITTKVYDLADAMPRPPRATSTYGAAGGTALSARQVALCLSFYADRNLPRKRGRIYIGPLNATQVVAERATGTLMTQVLSLGKAFAQITAGNAFVHVVHSRVGAGDSPVQNYWVNDVFDTIRSRVPKEAARQRYP